MLAEQLKKKKLGGEAFNFSDENPITVIEFINNIYNVAKLEPLYKVLNIAKYEIKHQYLDSQKARRILGWKPKNSLTKGLIKTISWYKDYYLNSKTIK
jgi:CDP-glucose 4,6-dehydratase